MRHLALLVLLLGACMTNKGDPPAAAADPPRTVRFVCDGGETVSIAFASRGARLTDATGQTVTLGQRPTGSGFSYQGDGAAIRGKGDELTLTRAGQSRACREEAAGADTEAAGLTGSRWRLVQFQSSDDAIGTIKPADPTRYTMELLDGGRAAMRLDCNRTSSTWQTTPSSATGGAISFTPGAMTRAFCGPASMDARIAQDLTRIRSFTLAGDTINFALEADGGLYTWARLP